MCVLVKKRIVASLLAFSALLVYISPPCQMPCQFAVICGMGAVTWVDALTNQRHSAFSIPHFTFCIPQFRILPTTINYSFYTLFLAVVWLQQ